MSLILLPDDPKLEDERPPAWCARHFAPYVGQPRLLVAVGDPLLEEFMCRVEVMNFCGLDVRPGRLKRASQDKLISALRHFTPVCCFLGNDVMAALLVEARERATRLPPGLPPLLIGGS